MAARGCGIGGEGERRLALNLEMAEAMTEVGSVGILLGVSS